MQFIEDIPFTTDAGLGASARCGLITLATDQTVEDEFRRVLPRAGATLYHTRLWNDPVIDPVTLRAIEARIAPATELLLPGLDFDVIAFGCTSAAMVIGGERVQQLVQGVKPSAKVTHPLLAVSEGMRAAGIRKIALLTPYVRSVNDGIAAWLADHGIEVEIAGSFSEPSDLAVARIDAGSVEQAALRLLRESDAQALFVSCTSIRTLEVVARIEAESGRLVTSSNHALAWHTLRLAGLDTAGHGPGRLFALA